MFSINSTSKQSLAIFPKASLNPSYFISYNSNKKPMIELSDAYEEI